MHDGSAVIPIVDPVDNTEHNEPLAEVCVVNLKNLINADDKTQLLKTDSTLLTKEGIASRISLH